MQLISSEHASDVEAEDLLPYNNDVDGEEVYDHESDSNDENHEATLYPDDEIFHDEKSTQTIRPSDEDSDSSDEDNESVDHAGPENVHDIEETESDQYLDELHYSNDEDVLENQQSDEDSAPSPESASGEVDDLAAFLSERQRIRDELQIASMTSWSENSSELSSESDEDPDYHESDSGEEGVDEDRSDESHTDGDLSGDDYSDGDSESNSSCSVE